MGGSTSLKPQTGSACMGEFRAEMWNQWAEMVLAVPFASLGPCECHPADSPH